MKQKSKINVLKLFKLGIFLLGVSLFLFNCEKEDSHQINNNTSLIQTVSKKESVLFLNQKKLLTKGGTTYLTYDISKISFENITNSDSKIAVIPAKIRESNFYSRILLLKINDTIKSVVYNMHSYPIQETAYFSGEVTLTNLNGKPIKSFKYLNGIMTNAYVLKDNTNSHKSIDDENEACRSICGHKIDEKLCNCNMQYLEEIVINSNSNNNSYVPIAILYGEDDDTGSSNVCEVNCYGWDDGGSGDNQDNTCSGGKVYNSVSGNCECAEGMIEDSSGNCIDNPCDDIKSQINATGFKGKKDELNKLTGKKEETGYVENKDGTFTKLNPIKNGHSLDLTGISFRNINGFIHTHLDDFETGKFDEETGLPEVNEIFRMFSPADVIAFLSIAKISTDISQVYATVITSSGDYMLRFTGNQNDITGVKLANDYKEDYIKYMKRYTNKEQGFLHFLKNHIKVNGIELYKLHKPLFSSDIKIEHKTLDTKGKVDKTECE